MTNENVDILLLLYRYQIPVKQRLEFAMCGVTISWVIMNTVSALTMLLVPSILTQPECRYTTKEPKGVISTPNFPNPYPVPIDCQWVIEAPADKVIAIYFTQFYMREGLKATEFAYYSPNVKMGKTEFGTISSDLEPTYLVSNKPVLVLDFVVREMTNIHMRVREYLLDVFGFNITYEMIARNESVRKDGCLYHHCSFTGNCYSSTTFDRYYCNCFSEYFGDECQYDAECGPSSTRSICQNGGTCRYYIGSTVRTCECPHGYDGARCETKQTNRPLVVGCVGPGCNANCSSRNSSSTGCNVPLEKQRYIISLLLTNPKASSVLADKRKLENFKKDMEIALHLLFKSRLDMYENITVLELRSDSVMKFHMLSSKNDAEEVKSTVDGMLKVGKLGIFEFDQTYFELHDEPALNIDQLEASEKMPVVEGQELTLACMVKGSESLQVEWFKDGISIYVHTNHRGMWTTVVPKNSQQQYTALLGFDRATSLDSGVFTCVVSDWGFVQNKTLSVSVLSAPQPQLTPMAATIFRGEQFVITCLSREDLYGTYGYTWLKNNQIINPVTDPEMIEDLFPAGSRILLMSAKSSATYTCIITSSAGSTRKDTVLTVLEGGKGIPTCPAEDFMKVKWSLAASNTEDRQLCPIGYTGDVRRKCSISNSRGAFWGDPDFSGCLTSSFISLKKKVESLKLGYLLADVTSLLRKLKSYLTSRKRKMNVCEGEPVVDLLDDIYSIDHVDRNTKDGWMVFLDIASILLESPRLLRKHGKIIQLHEQVFNYGFTYAESSSDIGFESFKRKSLAVEIGKIPSGRRGILKFPIQRHSRSTKLPEDPIEISPWSVNGVELELPTFHREDSEDNSTSSVAVVFYKTLLPYLPERFIEKKDSIDVECQLISNLIEARIVGQSLMDEDPIQIKVKLANFNYSLEDHIGWNISCSMADFSQGHIRFVTSNCQLIWTVENVSLCTCDKLGTYALLLTHHTIPEENNEESGFEIIAGIGCTICAFFLFITFILLLSVWRRIRKAIIVVKLQVCAALIGAYITFFCGVSNLFSEEYYPYMVTVIQFFLLSSFTLQLCLSLLVYIECIDLHNVPYSLTKIAALGWTLPVIVLGATLAAQSLDGFKLLRWWLHLGSTFFYSYTASILILTMFQVLLFLTIKSEIRNHGKVSDYLQKKKVRINAHRLKLLHRSLLLTTILLLVSVASILYVNFDNMFYKYFFAVTSSLLGIVVFMSYTFCSERHFILCCADEGAPECTEPEISSLASRNNSFKSFLKPEIIDDAYASKLHLEAERRSARIRRMYTQIEKAAVTKANNPYHPQEATADLLSNHPRQPDLSSPYPSVVPTESVDDTILARKIGDRDSTFFTSQVDTSGYPRMQWRYASHPHGFVDSPDSHRNVIHQLGSIQRPLLMESDTEPHESTDFGVGSTFVNPGHTVKADIVTLRSSQISVSAMPTTLTTFSDSSLTDVQDDRGSLKNTCFMRHTDSLETVVYCEDVKSSRDVSEMKHGPSWNMTSV